MNIPFAHGYMHFNRRFNNIFRVFLCIKNVSFFHLMLGTSNFLREHYNHQKHLNLICTRLINLSLDDWLIFFVFWYTLFRKYICHPDLQLTWNYYLGTLVLYKIFSYETQGKSIIWIKRNDKFFTILQCW